MPLQSPESTTDHPDQFPFPSQAQERKAEHPAKHVTHPSESAVLDGSMVMARLPIEPAPMRRQLTSAAADPTSRGAALMLPSVAVGINRPLPIPNSSIGNATAHGVGGKPNASKVMSVPAAMKSRHPPSMRDFSLTRDAMRVVKKVPTMKPAAGMAANNP